VARRTAAPHTFAPSLHDALPIFSWRRPELLPDAVARIREGLDRIDGLIDITDSRPIPGIEWRLRVDRDQAARFGADITTVGNARSEEHTSELQSRENLVCRLLLE